MVDPVVDAIIDGSEQEQCRLENARISELIEASLSSIEDIIRFGKERSIAPEIVVRSIEPLVDSAIRLAKLEKG